MSLRLTFKPYFFEVLTAAGSSSSVPLDPADAKRIVSFRFPPLILLNLIIAKAAEESKCTGPIWCTLCVADKSHLSGSEADTFFFPNIWHFDITGNLDGVSKSHLILKIGRHIVRCQLICQKQMRSHLRGARMKQQTVPLPYELLCTAHILLWYFCVLPPCAIQSMFILSRGSRQFSPLLSSHIVTGCFLLPHIPSFRHKRPFSSLGSS